MADPDGEKISFEQLYPCAQKGQRDGESYFGQLTFKTRFAYAFPMFGWYAMRYMKTGYMKKFYTDDYPRASLSVMSLCIVIATVLDIFVDPVVSQWTDGTRMIFGRDRGRRQPFLLASAFMALVLGPLAYAPPSSLSAAAASKAEDWQSTNSDSLVTMPSFASVESALWYGVIHILTTVFMNSVHDIPMDALGAELTPDFKQRTSLWAQWELWGVVGILFGLILPVLGDSECSSSAETGCSMYLLISLGLTGIFFASNAARYLLVKERPTASLVPEPTQLVATLVQSMHNRPFFLLLISDVVEGFGANLPMAVLPYVTEWVIGREACEAFIGSLGMFFAFLVVIHMIVRIPMTFVWQWAANRFGKFKTFLVFNILFGIQHLAFMAVGSGGTMVVSALAITWGMTYSGHWLLRDLASDVFDYDELLNGERREGHFMMALNLIPKILEVPADALPFMLMAYFGYNPSLPEQPQAVQWTLRLSFAALPGAAGLLGTLCILRYPLRTKEQHEAIIRGIAQHKAGEVATDPLTGLELPVMSHREDGTVVFGSDEVPGADARILKHFFAFEVDKAFQARDVAVLRKYPLMGFAAGAALAIPGLWIFADGFAALAEGEHSWSPVGLVLVGFGIIGSAFSAARLSQAQLAVQSELPLESLLVMTKIYASQGLLNQAVPEMQTT
mmetsp:Transcript_31469/g.57148  ORF Transcript_31469/g.57148 Transcript_31469/m.57148 type:complete len:675 (-) Transcript_31469:482-2506(-)